MPEDSLSIAHSLDDKKSSPRIDCEMDRHHFPGGIFLYHGILYALRTVECPHFYALFFVSFCGVPFFVHGNISRQIPALRGRYQRFRYRDVAPAGEHGIPDHRFYLGPARMNRDALILPPG